MSSSKVNPRPRRTDYWSGGIVSREQGTIVKDWGWRLPVCLVYPNSYFLGMSNLGVQVIYSLLNARDDVVCERAFWEGRDKPLESVESARPLGEYSCLAFSFSYEVDYFNLAPMLRTAGIPLHAKERGEDHPLLIAGGPCVMANPAPLVPFFDVLAIGEAEVLLPSMLPVLSAGTPRQEKLEKLAALPGMYVPAYNSGRRVLRRYLPILDEYPAHSVVLSHETELGELFLIEVERGCAFQCRFCLVSHTFCPLRFHSLAPLLVQAREGLRYRSRIGLVGPVVSQHPQIESLLQGLLDMGAGFSLSSLRLKPLSGSLFELIHKGGAESIALAPEAGSERLRQLIRKGFNEDDILAATAGAAKAGFKQLKYYFMLGLPGETDEDANDIAVLAIKCQLAAGNTGPRLSLNIAPFVPKAGTPWQRRGMADLATLERRLALIKDGLKGTGMEVKSESPEWSHIQGALSRGDAKMAEVIANIEVSSLAGWRRAVKKVGLDLAHYVTEDWSEEAPLPWSMVAPPENLVSF
jgi:radical SAM superfamily enzyme YgiQ (UPF0313 family)